MEITKVFEDNGWCVLEDGEYSTHPSAVTVCQKKILGVHVTLAHYRCPHSIYDIDFQIHEDESKTGITMNILMFSYKTLDLERIQNDCENVINPLIKWQNRVPTKRLIRTL